MLRGAFLVGPLWLLALRRDLFFYLGAATILVTGFGVLLTLYMAVPGQVFAGTLVYAVVLVVFVGLMVDKDMASPDRGPSLKLWATYVNMRRPGQIKGIWLYNLFQR